jgi:hypothetical protein
MKGSGAFVARSEMRVSHDLPFIADRLEVVGGEQDDLEGDQTIVRDSARARWSYWYLLERRRCGPLVISALETASRRSLGLA